MRLGSSRDAEVLCYRLFEKSILCLIALCCFFLSVVSFELSAKTGEDPSVFVDAPWTDHVRLMPNRGKDAVNILEHTLEVLSPEHIQSLPGFISYKKSKVTLLSYDFRSAEVVHALEKLLKLGVQVDVIADPSTVKLTKMPSKAVQKKWSAHQRDYFIRSFDGGDKKVGRDGVVSQADIDAYNHDKRLGRRFWSELEGLESKYKSQLSLLTSPDDVVPVDDDHRFPRLQHIKALMVQFLRTPRSKVWDSPVYLRMGSSNFTDSGMDPRGSIKKSEANIDAYFDPEKEAERKPNSRGHIQLNYEIKASKTSGTEFIGALVSPIWDLIDGFKQGKHFDELPIRDKRLSRVIFKEGTTLQSFYSEGAPRADRKAEDPLNRILAEYLTNPAMKLQEVFEAQFVFTHHNKSRELRKAIAKALDEGTLEDVFVIVDGSFSSIKESALDDMFFAEKIPMQETLSGRGIQNAPRFNESFDWRDSVFSYHGISALLIPPRGTDKMHAKAGAYRYIDDHGDTIYTIVAGSANSSTNAGRGNSDVLLVLETRDSKAWKIIQNFKQGIKSDEGDRIYPLSKVWLIRAFAEAFSKSMIPAAEKDETFFDRLSDFLSKENSSVEEYKNAFATILRFKPRSDYGKNLKQVLAWIGRNPALAKGFNWTELDLALRFADPSIGKTKAFLLDLRYRWIKGRFPVDHVGREPKLLLRSFVRLAKRINLAEHGNGTAPVKKKPRSRAEKIIAGNVTTQCEFFLNTKQGFHPSEIYRWLEVLE